MISIPHPITFMQGDEEGRVLMDKVVSGIATRASLDLREFDLSLESRTRTGDAVTLAAAESMRTTKVGLKAPTITPGASDPPPRLKSPNITLRVGVDGVAIVREANVIPGIEPRVRGLRGPITVIRKATEGIYEAMEWRTEDAETVYRQEFMSVEKMTALAEFAVTYALEENRALYAATKHTISRLFEGALQGILDETARRRAGEGLRYRPILIDSCYEMLMHPEPDIAIVCDNFNGDCLGDLVPAMFGSVAGCGSLLVGRDEVRMFDPPHGTARSLLGRDIANPLATLIAASGALAHAARLCGSMPGLAFARALKEAAFETIRRGVATKDLAGDARGVTTSEYLARVMDTTDELLAR